VTADPLDPRGLIREAYAMPGLGAAECRSIFLDWALGLPEGIDAAAAAVALRARWAPGRPDHPMTAVLGEGGEPRPRPSRLRRRG
jgi:hypothetical protein